MWTHRISIAGLGLIVIGLVGCVPRAVAPPPAPPAPPPQAPPAPPAPPPPAPEPEGDWRDVPLTPGDWLVRDGTARFGSVFALRCDGGRISLARLGAPAGRGLTIRTTYGERALPANGEGDATVAVVPADDRLLDEIAFSRGRFLVGMQGASPLFLPAWPEPARVIEECRGA